MHDHEACWEREKGTAALQVSGVNHPKPLLSLCTLYSRHSRITGTVYGETENDLLLDDGASLRLLLLVVAS